MFICARDLFKMLDDPNLILVDARSYKDYFEGHIPGAVNLDFFYYHWFDTSKEGMKAFNMQMRKLLSILGVTKEKTVVFYDDVSGMSASRGVWLLVYFSHKKAFMLDGGIKKWKSLGLPLEIKTNGFKPAKFSGKINKGVFAGFGHIPNAINIDWTLNIEEDGTMKKNESLSKLYKLSKDDEIVTYCQGGYRAANSFLALKKLGFKNVKVYVGSWGEWGNRLDLPVEQ
ncbi:MAG: sulfurtransferase [Thaumarchaeota archaeon]|nr:MAG: sulfurtransferase [Nitrososphaerota archaeon]